jgi:hypothetical protein
LLRLSERSERSERSEFRSFDLGASTAAVSALPLGSCHVHGLAGKADRHSVSPCRAPPVATRPTLARKAQTESNDR